MVTARAGSASRLATPAIVAAMPAWPGLSRNTWPPVLTSHPLVASSGATRRKARYPPAASRMIAATAITAIRPRLLLVPGTRTERTRSASAARLARHGRRTRSACWPDRIPAARPDRRVLGAARRTDPRGCRRPRGGGRGGGHDRRGARQGRLAGPADWRDRRGRAGQAGDPARLPAAADGRLAGGGVPLPRPGAAHQPPRRRPGGGRLDRPLG